MFISVSICAHGLGKRGTWFLDPPNILCLLGETSGCACYSCYEECMNISLVVGDITEQRTDAIVNAANKWLIRGSGVCGAIHRAAGPELETYCKALGGCETGEAKITPGFKLPAKYVIHTVGPRFGRENGNEGRLLSACHINSLELAEENDVRAISFPAISTGVYGYPIEQAAIVVARALDEYTHGGVEQIDEIRFVFRDPAVLQTYWQAFQELESLQRLTNS